MSFSSDIKRVLCGTDYECKNCKIAELAGFFRFTDRLGRGAIKVNSAFAPSLKRVSRALFDEFGICAQISERRLEITDEKDVLKLIQALNGDVIRYECCGAAYIRGAFLGGGSVSDPNKEYHIEFDTRSEKEAQSLSELLEEYSLKPKRTRRKGREVIYIKEAAQIAELIGVMSGGRAGLEFFSVQVEKEIKNDVVRRVNCDSANLNKQAAASSRHIAAIRRIKAAGKWDALPEVLREIGELRLKYPEMSIESLGSMTRQGIGKSGVNHRLSRILDFARSLGNKESESK